MLKLDARNDRMRGARCWLAGAFFTSCLIGSGEVLAWPMAGEYQLDVESELRICSETQGCREPVSIAGARFQVHPDSPWILGRELSDMTCDLYEGDFESEGIYQVHTVINSPDLGPYAFSDDSYVTFFSDTSFQWTGSFEGYLSCDSFGLDPASEDCWSSESRDFELINVSATMVPEPGSAIQLGLGLLVMLVVQSTRARNRRPAAGGASTGEVTGASRCRLAGARAGWRSRGALRLVDQEARPQDGVDFEKRSARES